LSAQVGDGVRRPARGECQPAHADVHQPVPELERELALDDEERLVEVVHMQRRARGTGGHHAFDDADTAVAVFTTDEDLDRR
jgi:hypothetical protein